MFINAEYVVNVLAKSGVKTLNLVKREFLKQVCSCKLFALQNVLIHYKRLYVGIILKISVF